MKRHVCLLAVAAAIVAVMSAGAEAAPRLINYQGVITDTSGQPLDGTHDLIFRIYPDSIPGTDPLWEEAHSGVTVADGLFNVILGGLEPISPDLFAAHERWMGIQVDASAELSPRMRMTSVPWALRAAIADSVDSIAGVTDGDWTVDGDDMYAAVPGNVGIGTTTPAPSAVLDLVSTSKGFMLPRLTQEQRDAIVGPADGLVIFNTTTSCIEFYVGGNWLALCGSGCVVDECDEGDASCVDLPGGGVGFRYCVVDEHGCGTWATEDCDDGNACTIDTCDPVLGCVHTPIDCNDGIFCTEDSCDPVTGCTHTPNDVACDDGNACTVDYCDPVLGCMHDLIVCDDGNPCTTDYCDPVVGCVFDPMPDGTPCGDDMICIGGDCVPCGNGGGDSCAAAVYMGVVCGDEAQNQIVRTGCGGGWFRFDLSECSSALVDLNYAVQLIQPSGAEYDLYIYSECGNQIAAGSGGQTLCADGTVADGFSTDDSREIFVEVRMISTSTADTWELRVLGNTLCD